MHANSMQYVVTIQTVVRHTAIVQYNIAKCTLTCTSMYIDRKWRYNLHEKGSYCIVGRSHT